MGKQSATGIMQWNHTNKNYLGAFSQSEFRQWHQCRLMIDLPSWYTLLCYSGTAQWEVYS